MNAAETEIITKRIILNIASRFYDPVGLISPIVLPFKLILQELCQKALRWDDPVDENICSKWKALVRHLREVGTISLKRCYYQSSEDSRSVELHVFRKPKYLPWQDKPSLVLSSWPVSYQRVCHRV